jgi:hypothetical protein
MSIPVPPTIYCPKCGELLRMHRISEPQTQAKLEESGYVAGARGICKCGVVAILAIKKMPENPTFTLMFNIYKFEVGRE